MHLVQLLLPMYDNRGAPFPPEQYARVRRELTGRFGGLTAFVRAPASGEWRDEGRTVHDDLIVYEVMTAQLDRDWWGAYRRALEERFAQQELVIRTQLIERL